MATTLRQIALLLLSGIVILQTTTGCRTVQQAQGRVVGAYTLPPYSLTNWGYTAGELVLMGSYLPTDRPAIGSGLHWLGANEYLSVTDRGPTVKPAEDRLFPAPSFTPTIVRFRVAGSEIIPTAHLPIVISPGGAGVTGIPNNPTNDCEPYVPPGTPQPCNPNGLDVEDIHLLPDGRYLLVEEYGPSVVVVSAEGVALKRYIPASKTLPGAAYPVSPTLPSILDQARPNRGFESLAVSRDGRIAYTLTQSPLGPAPVAGSQQESCLFRVLRMDVTEPLKLRVTGQFILRLGAGAGHAGKKTIIEAPKVSAAAWVAEGKLLLLERTEADGRAGARLVLADLTAATDITGMPDPRVPGKLITETLTLEKGEASLAALGVTPGVCTEVLSFGEETPEIKAYKLEGLTILDAKTVAVSNDNDFGASLEPEAKSRVWVIRLKRALPLGE